MGLVTILTATTTILDAAGNPADGTVSVRPNASWTYDNASGGKDRVDPKPVSITIANGKISAPSPLKLAPTLNGGVNMTDASYTVTYNLTGTPIFDELWAIDSNAGSIEWGSIQVLDSSMTTPGLPVAGPTGAKGDTGLTGPQGQSVDHVTRTSGNGAAGTTDTYTMWADAGETIAIGTFLVYNGSNGLITGTQQAFLNESTISSDMSIQAGSNAMSAGPLTIAEGVTVTVADNANWSII